MSKKFPVQAILLTFATLLFVLLLILLSAPAFGGDTDDEFHYLPMVQVEAGTPTPTPTPTNTPLPTTIPPGAVPNVVIDLIEYNPAGSDLDNEFVRIRNDEAGAVDMTGWQLTDDDGTSYTFPSFELAGGATVRVWVKAGADDSANLYMGRNRSVWTNTGDVGYLYNANGTLVDSCSYTGGGVSAGCK